MNDRFDRDGPQVPDELRALDAELSSIRYEERPSFGPELEAELAQEWGLLKSRRPTSVRPFVAAAVVAALLATAGVPSARASLVRLIGSFQGDVAGAADVQPEVRPTEPDPTPVVIVPPPVEVSEEASQRATVPMDPPSGPEAIDRTEWPVPTMPEVLDRVRVEAQVFRDYPLALQRAGVGGSVALLLWVDSTGAVDFVNLVEGSGVPELDRVALQVAPSIRFRPATRRGRAVGTWVQFPIVFRVDPDAVDPLALPIVEAFDGPEVDEPLDLTLIPEWQGEIALLAPVQREAGELLEAAIDDDDLIEELGPIESILAGEPPAGVAPTQWRSEVTLVLERVMVRDPNNPAPLLALARIRRKQGLRTEARALFERGIQRAERAGGGVSPSLFAELHYQRATLIKEAWLAHRDLGRVSTDAFAGAVCPTATSTGRGGGGFASGGAFASAGRLIVWNYLCPAALGDVFESGFEATEQRGSDDFADMMGSFHTAVAAYPEHVGANVEILLALADEGRWSEVLDGARRFVRASRGHPYGLLIGGLALQRLARSDEADNQFTLALRGLPESEADALQDVRFVLGEDGLADYRRVASAERRDWEQRFWAPLDPILSTAVNERSVEHVARSAYAHLRFGSTDNDAGEVWIRYGRPRDIKVVGQSAGLRTEFWDYGAGPDFTFSRVGSSRAMDLTSEGRAYADDLREVLAHRYGASSRSVFTLPGQVTRFYGGEPGVLEVQIHTEVPAFLATSSSDTLDLGLFLLDAEGNQISVVQRLIKAEVRKVELRAPTSPDVASIVVELFNRRTGQAGAIREAVTPLVVHESVAVSDLLLVRPTRSPKEVSRYADWLEPLSLVGALGADAVGVYFEVYETGAAVTWYRLRAEVVDRETGVVTGVPIRPAGEDGFRPTWDRFPAAGGLTSEFLTVALSDVERGRHTLRIIVDVPEVGAGVVVQRDLDRREDPDQDWD
jgi:protein TonB